ncbi:MAG: substrate-binding domain-containing protein, partial [Spirochaetes bacterium]|nr:substrate-binding domain-containing protein [Spirochaetota bacterium]
EGPIGQSAQIDRREGNMTVLDANPDVELLEMQTANWSRSEALDLMENWLNAHPGEIDGVIGQNDEMALGAIEAIKQAGLDLDDFVTAGIDGVTDALEAVKAGEHDRSILQDATAQAQGALDVLLRELVGSDYEPQAAVWDELDFADGQEDVYNVPWVPVTLDNVDQLLETRAELTTRE